MQPGASAARKRQNLLGRPVSDFVRLIGRCELFAGATRAGCYRWLGKAIAVLTDSAFGGHQVARSLRGQRPRLRDSVQARTMEDALVTFS